LANNPALDYALADRGNQSNVLALAKTEFDGQLINDFHAETNILEGVTYRFGGPGSQTNTVPFVGQLQDRLRDDGSPVGGQTLPAMEREINYDAKEVESVVLIPRVEDFRSHINKLPSIARESAYALARRRVRRSLTHIALGARRLARPTSTAYSFKGGVRVRQNGSVFATEFPMSATGSRALQALLANAALGFQAIDQNPNGMWKAFCTPTTARVLAADNTLSSMEYSTEVNGRIFTRMVNIVENFMIIPTNFMPSLYTPQGGSAGVITDDETQYNANVSKSIFLLATGPTAVGIKEANSIESIGPTYDDKTRTTYAGAVTFSGIKWMQPEHCGEIYLHTSDYATTTDSTNGDYVSI